jgi:iron(II)-dependent oxidoreductase
MALLQADRLERAREQTLALVAAVADEDLERVHSTLMSPLVWDLGHIAAFEDLWLAHRHGGLPLLHPELADVYDAFETPRAGRGELPYLRRDEAEQYMDQVRDRVRALELEDDDPLVLLISRHERQHAETMLQTLALAALPYWSPPHIQHKRPAETHPEPTGLDLLAIPAELVPIGTDSRDAYDNERPQHQLEVEAFRIGRSPVTNDDWRAFVEAGGYARRELWSSEGWDWRVQEGVERPLQWRDGDREQRLDGLHPIDGAAPVVHVSFYEAEAFVALHGLRLPSEFEWELAATWDGERKLAFPWGEEPPAPRHANLIESAQFAPLPAGSLPDGAAPCGALAMIGDVWEWTASEFRGYDGFVAHPYREYSEVFFGAEHRVLRGGSFAASAEVVTPTFRNWDYPSRRQIFSGLRVAADAA